MGQPIGPNDPDQEVEVLMQAVADAEGETSLVFLVQTRLAVSAQMPLQQLDLYVTIRPAASSHKQFMPQSRKSGLRSSTPCRTMIDAEA